MAALFMVVIMGIMMGVAGQSIRVVMKREKEKELIFRGLQYRDAIERWAKKGAMPLLDVKDLLKNPHSPNGERLIRQLYKDPMTGEEWKILKDPQLGIYGVVSTSDEESIKQGNFPEVIKSFEGKKKYSEWEFIFKRQVNTAAGTKPNQQQLSFPLSTPEGE